ncbi:LytR/AlgR family response regulator transcription factor [Polaribacter porphyrae]|uniref:DNA-binding response regulator n=1 Tax=Polaribacter porphyrae TaxID=1137780 RepID=A0A2S7WRD8_9FLAO|nr:response regulator transcription factor [Polaribacter porphyrae]PQJ80154.1 DNA-binding response regulator [Polaribacter porphyrae]
MYNCVIVDDEPLARELIESYLEKLPNFKLIASCANAIEAGTILTTEKVDLLFLDIEMPVLKGTTFIKNLANKPKVIFTTAYRDYALDSYELDALDYLLKPIFFERFFAAIQKFLKTKNTDCNFSNIKNIKKNNYVFVNKAKKQIKVDFDKIIYLESFKDYIKIHFKEDTLMIKESISSFEKKIDKRFIRIHRSYIVNSEKITAFTKNDIEVGNIEIPIGNSYKENMIPFLNAI